MAILTWDGESSTPADVKYVCSVDNEKEVQNNRLMIARWILPVDCGQV